MSRPGQGGSRPGQGEERGQGQVKGRKGSRPGKGRPGDKARSRVGQ